jgi:bla regulator protein blaR1
MGRPKLAKLELRILEVLWARGKASMREVQEAFPEPRPAYTTITNTVYRMEAKHAVRRVLKIGNADIFEPLIAKDAARDSLLDEILSFFGGRPQPMMAQLVESGRLTLDDIRELEKAAAEADSRKACGNRNDYPVPHQPSLAGIMLRAFGGIGGVRPSREFAEDRYWVWLSASLKFLIPFALLVNLGSVVPRPTRRPVPVAVPVFPDALVQIPEPFSPSLESTVPVHARQNWGPAAIGAVWALGFFAITLARCRSWLGVRAALRAGTPVELPIPVRTLITPGAREPGIVGILGPVLVLPAQLLEHLNPRQLHAILTHELCHVRRRDNFFAAIHMVVEGIFWFHPLVWWIGSRMIEERELACDEEVLRMGCEPADYATGILTVCRFYTEPALHCISGVTGADVKRRLRTILAGSIANELSTPKKMTLASIGLAALAAPVLIGMLNAPIIDAQSPTGTHFDVASVKPTSQQGPDIQGLGSVQILPGGRLFAEKALLRYFIQNAYGIKPFQISGGPAWINSAHYDIDAKAEGNPSPSQMRLMMQALLEERFKLKLHHETKTLPVYELIAAKSGPKLPEPTEGSCLEPDPNEGPSPPAPGQPISCGRVLMMMSPAGAQMRGGRVSMPELVRVLSNVLGRVVVDKTGFRGAFDVHLVFSPDETLGGLPTPPPAPSPSNDSARSASPPDSHGNILTAIDEQLGLKLEPSKGPVDILVIDSVERPSAN